MFIKEFTLDDKPRERAKSLGFKNLTTTELIALIIRSGSKKESVIELSQKILKRNKSLYALKTCNINELNTIYGMGDAKSISLLAALELANRYKNEEINDAKFKITNPEQAFKYMSKFEFNIKQEEFYIICLNSRKEVVGSKMIFKGTINASIIHPREIFQYVIEMSSSFVILAHNHPSRNLTPSKEDIAVTNRLYECGNLLNINVLDHIIFSDTQYLSLKEIDAF